MAPNVDEVASCALSDPVSLPLKPVEADADPTGNSNAASNPEAMAARADMECRSPTCQRDPVRKASDDVMRMTHPFCGHRPSAHGCRTALVGYTARLRPLTAARQPLSEQSRKHAGITLPPHGVQRPADRRRPSGDDPGVHPCARGSWMSSSRHRPTPRDQGERSGVFRVPARAMGRAVRSRSSFTAASGGQPEMVQELLDESP